MAARTGFVLIWRSIRDHPVLAGPDERWAWACMIMDADHQTGQLILSSRGLGDEHGWTRAKARRFLDKLEKHGMIAVMPAHVPAHPSGPPPTLLTICNYSKWQRRDLGTGPPLRPTSRPTVETRESTLKDPPIRGSEAHASAPVKAPMKGPKINGHPLPAGFAEFWLAYPKKEGQLAAEREWRKLMNAGIEPAWIMAKVNALPPLADRRHHKSAHWFLKDEAFVPPLAPEPVARLQLTPEQWAEVERINAKVEADLALHRKRTTT